MVTCSVSWASWRGYWAEGLTGGAGRGLSAAWAAKDRAKRAAAAKVRSERMGELIIIVRDRDLQERRRGEAAGERMGMAMYSFLLAVGLGVSAPWWGWRMARDGRYREGLSGRLGRVPAGLRAAVEGKRVGLGSCGERGGGAGGARLVGSWGSG